MIFTRDGGGHVAFYVGETATQIKVLGGNQSNSVSVANYPKSRLLGFRRVLQAKSTQPAPQKPPAPQPPVARPQPAPEPEDALAEPDTRSGWEKFIDWLLSLFRK